MTIPRSGYVQVTVRNRRFVGTWTALQNIVVRMTVLQDSSGGFFVPVNHIMVNGETNKFPVVKFKRRATFLIVDTQLPTPSKPVRLYEADKADADAMIDAHFELLVRALTEHGCCVETKDYSYKPTFTRRK